MRKGMGKGKGKGYKNLPPTFSHDKRVHTDSGHGRKQPQRVPYSALIEQTPKWVGKAHSEKVPDIKIEQIGGDVDWEEFGGQFIVDEKFNNGEFDYYIIIDFINLKEAVGDEAKSNYVVTVNVVAPSEPSKEDIDRAFESIGVEKNAEKMFKKDKKALAGVLFEYGLKAEVFQEEGNNSKKLMDTAKKQIPAITGLFGFYLDKPVNRIGNTGWDAIRGDIGFKR